MDEFFYQMIELSCKWHNIYSWLCVPEAQLQIWSMQQHHCACMFESPDPVLPEGWKVVIVILLLFLHSKKICFWFQNRAFARMLTLAVFGLGAFGSEKLRWWIRFGGSCPASSKSVVVPLGNTLNPLCLVWRRVIHPFRHQYHAKCCPPHWQQFMVNCLA